MRFTIDTKSLDRLRASFSVFSDRRFAAGLATALTRTAQAVGAAQTRELRDVFDRPTPYTLRSIFVDGATAARLVARAGIKDDFGTARGAIKWLRWHIDGGRRRPKAYEKLLMRAGAMPDDTFSVPGRFARLDSYGNISTGQLRQVLSQLRIEPTVGATSALPRVSADDNAATRKAKQRRISSAYRRAGGQYVAFPNGRGRLRPGIYQVRSTAFGRTDPRPVLIFVTRADYEAGRFDFDYVSDLAIRRNLGPQVDRAMSEQLARWAAKGRGG